VGQNGIVEHRPPSPHWLSRTLVLAISLSLASAGGVIAARSVDPAQAEPRRIVAEAPAAPEAPEPADLEPLGALGAHLVEGLSADLPVPLPPPAQARAATPEVRHGMLEIPSIGLAQPFFEGVTLTAIDRGPSHWPGTAMPGELGNVVMAGHRTTRTRPFWDLDLVQPGAELIFTMNDGTRHVYLLDRTEVVDDEDVHIVDQSYGYRATLFGCHPKGSARQRIVGHFSLHSTTPPSPPPTPSA
jgi:sortase A